MNEICVTKTIEQLNNAEIADHITDYSIRLGTVAMQLSYELRVPRYNNGERENDSEHSYMLALVAPEIAHLFRPDLDSGLVGHFAIAHELPELITKDKPTFHLSAEEEQQKVIDDALATGQIAPTLPPFWRDVLLRYEAQKEPEARFVRFIDKLLPIVVDIVGEGMRVMNEDYNVATIDELRCAHEKLRQRFERMFGGEFPEINLAHRLLQEMFEVQFMSYGK